jgi:segregation and condensation protein A
MDVPVKLEIFEGPLDLLLHLIRKNEVDIYDIPVAFITRQYLEYLDLMRELNIGLAGEFLVMAATLAHIKSRMLLPSYDAGADSEAEEDPRSDLVAQLKEHMRLKAAAERLAMRPWLDRDVFSRGGGKAEQEAAKGQDKGQEVIKAGVFELMEAFRRLLKGRGAQMSLALPSVRLSLEERMGQILERLRSLRTLTFEEIFEDVAERGLLVVTFLALLELARLGLIRAYQERGQAQGEGQAAWGPLRIYFIYQHERWEEPPDESSS